MAADLARVGGALITKSSRVHRGSQMNRTSNKDKHNFRKPPGKGRRKNDECQMTKEFRSQKSEIGVREISDCR